MESFDEVIEGFRVKMLKFNQLYLGVAVDIGPRILYAALASDKWYNLFEVVPTFGIETSEGLWRIYGGHRLWVSPEAMPRSYSIDDKPVNIVVKDGEVVIEGNPEPQNSIQKRLIIREGVDEYSVEVVHEVINIGRWPIEFSCWALSVMRRNGFAIAPIESRCTDEKCLLPDRVLVLWPYTRLTDERLTLTDKYIIIRQDPTIDKPFKIGVKVNPPWAAYYVSGYLFVKFFKHEEAVYPDYGSTVEIYTNNLFLELETLGPLRKVDPEDTNRHKEVWKVVKIGPLEPNSKDIAEKVEPIVNEMLNKIGLL